MFVLFTDEACFNSAHMWTLITVNGLQEIQWQSKKPHYMTLRLVCCGLSVQLWLLGPIFPFWDHKFTPIITHILTQFLHTALFRVTLWLQNNKQGIMASMFTITEPVKFFMWGTLKNKCITTDTLIWYYKTVFTNTHSFFQTGWIDSYTISWICT